MPSVCKGIHILKLKVQIGGGFTTGTDCFRTLSAVMGALPLLGSERKIGPLMISGIMGIASHYLSTIRT